MFKQLPNNPQLRVSLEPLIHIDEDWHEILRPKSDNPKAGQGLKPVNSTIDGEWAMVSLFAIKDLGYQEGKPEYPDGRLSLVGNHYLAYSFAGQQLYCVREVEGDKAAHYVIPLTDLGKSNWEEFKALNQYRPALLAYGAEIVSGIADRLTAVIAPLLPFVDVQTESIDLNAAWESSMWEPESRSNDYTLYRPTLGDFESILQGYEFNSELQLMVKRKDQKQACTESTDLEDIEQDTSVATRHFSREFYDRSKDIATGDNLKRARESKGLSQSELASITGRTQAQISNMESGKSEPSLKYLLMLSEICNKSMGETTGETCADWVGKLIWIGKGYGAQMTCNKTQPYSNFEVRYGRYRVVANDPVEKVIFVVPSKPEVTGISSGSDDKDFNFKLEVFGSNQYEGLSAFPLRGACFKILEDTDNYNKDNISYPDIIFIPRGETLNKYIEATGGWRVSDNSPHLPGGFRFFDQSGNLVPLEGYAEPKGGGNKQGTLTIKEKKNERQTDETAETYFP